MLAARERVVIPTVTRDVDLLSTPKAAWQLDSLCY